MGDGTTREWQSGVMPRYQGRTERVDEAILGLYLAGANTRRLKTALAPLLKGTPLSKDAVSRLVGRMSEDFEFWRTRELANEDIVYVFMDGWYPKTRMAFVATGRRVVDQRLANRYFATVEAEALRGLPAEQRRERFFRYWTLKESFIKALGVGFKLNLAHFSFHLDEGAPVRVTFDPVLGEKPEHWQFAEFRTTERHRMAVSIRKGDHRDLGLTLAETVPNSG